MVYWCGASIKGLLFSFALLFGREGATCFVRISVFAANGLELFYEMFCALQFELESIDIQYNVVMVGNLIKL